MLNTPVHRRRLCLAIALAAASVTWAGREIPSQPGDAIIPNEYVVRMRPGFSLSDVLPPGSYNIGPNARTFQLLRIPGNATTLVQQIALNPRVLYIESNHQRDTSLNNPNDPSYASQWALTTIKAAEAWATVAGKYLTSATAGTGRVKVAVLDTGLDCSHPDFANAGGASTNSANGGQINVGLSVALIPTTVPNPPCAVADDHGHGTHTSGTVASATNNAAGVASLGHYLEIFHVKVLGASGSGTDVTIANAIMLAADAGAAVISLSLGGTGYSQVMQDAVRYAWERNSLVVAAAGNNNSNVLFFPAAANYAAGVAASTDINTKASFSNFGLAVDIAAPGVSILSTYKGGAYATMSGTSMATPHVAALAGLLRMISPGIPVTAILQRMQQTASSTITGWEQTLGYGIMDAARAVTGNLPAKTTGSIVGQAVDDDGLPLSGVQLSVAGLNLTTGTSGLFRFANLAPGLHQVAATAPGLPAQSVPVVVTPGADSSVTIPMGVALGRFTGVVSVNGIPQAGAVVEALQGGLVKVAGFTGVNGVYTIAVPAGVYDVRSSAFGKTPATVSAVTATGGVTETANLSMGALGALGGTVTGTNGVPIANAQISLTGANGFLAGAITNASGDYQTQAIPAGDYQVTASAAGYPAAPLKPATIGGGLIADLDFSLGSVTVTVTPANKTLAPSMSQAFSATVTGAGQSVTWTRSPATGTISAAGVYTAPSSISGIQNITITATSVDQPTKFGTATVKLSNVLTLSLAASMVEGATTTTNKVTLAEPAPAGGATVVLSTNDPALTVPASVFVAAGATVSANFTVTANYVVGIATTATVSAAYDGVTRSGNVTVNPTAVTSVGLSPASLAGGTSGVSNKVNLNGPADPGGKVVWLTSSNPSVATVPNSVTVPGGATGSPNFTITTTAVAVTTTVTITATLDGVSKTATLTVTPLALSSIALSPTNVVGGVPTTANKVNASATAAAATVVTLASSNTAVAIVPESVTVPVGANFANFTITTKAVTVQTYVTISATLGGVIKSQTLTVNPVALSSITVSMPYVVGSLSTTANKVTLNGPAPPGGAIVTIGSSNPGVATPPASVSIPEGATTSATFTITSTLVTVSTPVTISGTFGGVAKSGTLTVNPMVVASFTPTAMTVTGGNSYGYYRVNLNATAPTGGIVVALSSSDTTVATVPASITVPAGASASPTFTSATTPVTSTRSVTITATYGTSVKTATLTVNPPGVSAVALSPATVVEGAGSSVRVTLNGPAPAGGLNVPVSSANPARVSPPATVFVPAGATVSAYVPFTTSWTGAASGPVAITATAFDAPKSANLTVNKLVASTLTLGASSVKGGNSVVNNRVTLNGVAPPAGAAWTVTSSDPSVVPPSPVTVLAGQTNITFTMTTTAVPSSRVVTISASYGGVTKTVNITVNP